MVFATGFFAALPATFAVGGMCVEEGVLENADDDDAGKSKREGGKGSGKEIAISLFDRPINFAHTPRSILSFL